jgi:hypothetical protein
MSTVGFVIHAGRASAVGAADALRTALTRDGVETLDLDGNAADVDLVVAVGGARPDP